MKAAIRSTGKVVILVSGLMLACCTSGSIQADGGQNGGDDGTVNAEAAPDSGDPGRDGGDSGADPGASDPGFDAGDPGTDSGSDAGPDNGTDNGTGSDSTPDPCSGVDCGPHGVCQDNGGQPSCRCDSGYHDSGGYCVADSQQDPCANFNCGDHGSCVPSTGQPICVCEPGYYIHISGCTPNDASSPCAALDCSGHGTCVWSPIAGTTCNCYAGYMPYGAACVLERRLGCRNELGNFVPRGTTRCDATNTFLEVCNDGDGDGLAEWIFGANCVQTPCSDHCRNAGCDVQPCPTGTSCVTEAHGQPLNVCVVGCDCDNCGNCGPDADWSSMQNFCGNPGGTTPTLGCTLPCPDAGTGCIPYSPQLCWPLEGCFSGPPL